MDTSTAAEKLDPREEHYLIPSQQAGLRLFLRHLPPIAEASGPVRAVLYVHGATFPSALSVAHKFDGRSWSDAFAAAGFHAWALDFHGFGLSDRYPTMAMAPQGEPLCRAPDAVVQLEQAVRFITRHHGVPAVSLVAHSWGTLVAGLFATRHPTLLERLAFFGPITRREIGSAVPALPSWVPVTLAAQRSRFVDDVPACESSVLDPQHLAEWSERYLATDAESTTRTPPAVATPAGPVADIQAAWHGALAYDPSLVRAPVAILRGEWDNLCTDADARWLWDALTAAPEKRDVKISRATHLMHLESGRHALHRESVAFLGAK